MTSPPLPQSGYTLPVFACAAAVAALRHLQGSPSVERVSIDLLVPDEQAVLQVEQVARLSETSALAITRSEPGDNLDLTRHTPVWALVTLCATTNEPRIQINGGEGIGRQVNADNRAAIYSYAQRLLHHNLSKILPDGVAIEVTLILPEGRSLAERTSNAAFGVIDGLSLLGTTGIAQPLSAPGQLEHYRDALRQKATQFKTVVFCVGENGLALAEQIGIPRDRLLKTANWLGPMLVEAGLLGVHSILLFGYHGKLLKLAGGIFHTHHHVADARQEIFTALCAQVGLPQTVLQTVFNSPTIETALQHLRQWDTENGTAWVQQVYREIAQRIDDRAASYIKTHSDCTVRVGSILFDRNRKIVIQSAAGATLLSHDLLS